MMLIPTHISRALILVPNNYLRSQVVDVAKWQKSADRYNLPAGPRGIPVAEANRPPYPPFPRENALFVSMTMQMAIRYKNLLLPWIDSEKHKYGVPPLVFVDEAHTGSAENQWGRCVNELAESGAFVVLLTATPFRTDREYIPGFELERVSVEEVSERRRNEDDHDLWDIFEGKRHLYRLKAHHATTFREAWAAPTQGELPVLCDITRRPFDIETEEIDPLTGEFEGDSVLSRLSDRDSARVLSMELRKPRIINQACQILVRVLTTRMKEASETAAIVFVGNDRDEDRLDNEHALSVKAAINRLSPKLRVEIATSTTTQANRTIERFVRNVDIDVLIVKQMAGLGVDCERLKVCLDLSTVRTLNAFIQRVTRIATIWDRREVSGNEWDIVTKADYITPDDRRGKQLYNLFIRDQGGGHTQDDLEYVGTIASGGGQGGLPNEVIARQVVAPEEVQDSKLQTAPGSTLPVTDRVFAALPELTKTRTQPDLAKALVQAGIEVPGLGEDRNPKPATSTNGLERPVVRNLNEENKRIREELEACIKREATVILGRGYSRGDNQWVSTVKSLRIQYRNEFGIPWNVVLEDIEQDLLEAMLKSVKGNLSWRRESE